MLVDIHVVDRYLLDSRLGEGQRLVPVMKPNVLIWEPKRSKRAYILLSHHITRNPFDPAAVNHARYSLGVGTTFDSISAWCNAVVWLSSIALPPPLPWPNSGLVLHSHPPVHFCTYVAPIHPLKLTCPKVLTVNHPSTDSPLSGHSHR